MQVNDQDLLAPFDLHLTGFGQLDCEMQAPASELELDLPTLPRTVQQQAPRKRGRAKQQPTAKAPGITSPGAIRLFEIADYQLKLPA